MPPKSCSLSTSEYTDNLTTVDVRKSFVCAGFSSMYVLCLCKQTKALACIPDSNGEGLSRSL